MELKAEYMPASVSWEVGPVKVTVTAQSIRLDTWGAGDEVYRRRPPLPVDDLIGVLGVAKQVHLDMRALKETAPKEDA